MTSSSLERGVSHASNIFPVSQKKSGMLLDDIIEEKDELLDNSKRSKSKDEHRSPTKHKSGDMKNAKQYVFDR